MASQRSDLCSGLSPLIWDDTVHLGPCQQSFSLGRPFLLFGIYLFPGWYADNYFHQTIFKSYFPHTSFRIRKNPTKNSFSSLFVTCSGICKDHHQADNSSCRGKVKNIQSINFLLICVSEKTQPQQIFLAILCLCKVSCIINLGCSKLKCISDYLSHC